MLWLYLYFPQLQLDTQAPDAQEPIAIVDEKEHHLVQLNQAASHAGITRNMGLATAAALCRDIQLLPYQGELETRRLHELAQGLYALSGDISLDSPNGIWLGADRMVMYHNGLNNYCINIERFLSRQNLHYQLASGFSPFVAKLLAQSGQPTLSDNPETLRCAWQARSLGDTGLPNSTLVHLRRLGIKTLGQLVAIPFKELSQRFDAKLVQYLGRLTGQLPHPLPFFHPPEYFRRHRELPHELESSPLLMPWIERLLMELEQFLEARDQVVERIELQLFLRDQDPCHLTIGSARGESRAERWVTLVQLTLERHPLDAPVGAIALVAQTLLSRQVDEQDLLGEQRGNTLEPNQLVALLQARLGSERVRGLAVAPDFRPLQACAEASPLKAHPSPQDDHPRPPDLRPGFLLPEPHPYSQPLEILGGPERISAGWWDGGPQVRDYYIARNVQGQWCWVFREPGKANWFLQGYFG